MNEVRVWLQTTKLTVFLLLSKRRVHRWTLGYCEHSIGGRPQQPLTLLRLMLRCDMAGDIMLYLQFEVVQEVYSKASSAV